MSLTRSQILMVAVFLSGTLLAVLNQTLLSPALPSIMADMGVDASTVQWLTSGYSLVEAAVIPLSAYLIGRFTTRQLFITGMVLFFAGSALSAWAPAFWALLLGRALQAMCTGAIMPMVMTIVLLTFPRERRGFAMGLVSLIIGFAPAVGPSLAGVVIDHLGWRPLFAIVAVLAVVVIALAFAFVRNKDGFTRITLDAPSMVLSSLGMVCLLYGVSCIGKEGSLVLTVGLCVVGAALLAAFVMRQNKLETPLLLVSVLKAPRYAVAVAIAMVSQVAIVGLSVIMPLYIQNVLGHSATVSGVVMLPGALMGALVGLVSGRLFDRIGPRPLVLGGGAVVVLGMLGLCFLDAQSNMALVTASYSIMICGLMFIGTPLNTWGINSLHNSVIQHANAVTNTLNQIAASIGTAALVALSSFGPQFAPGADALTQTFTGQHAALIGATVMGVIAYVIMVVFVRDSFPRAKAGTQAGASAAAKTSEAVPSAGSAPHSITDLDTAADIMKANPYAVLGSATVRDAITIMLEAKTSGLPVMDAKGGLVGFVSDGDIVNYLGQDQAAATPIDSFFNAYMFDSGETYRERTAKLLDLSVDSIATKHVISVEADTPVERACRILADGRIKKLPVTQDGALVGTLSRGDVMRSIMAESAGVE